MPGRVVTWFKWRRRRLKTAEELAYERLYGPNFWRNHEYRSKRYIALLRGEITAEEYVAAIQDDIDRDARSRRQERWP